MLYIEEEYRGKGYGGAILAHWENEMKTLGHTCVMTSTLSTETARQAGPEPVSRSGLILPVSASDFACSSSQMLRDALHMSSP